MKAEDVMTRAVITIDPDATVLQAARLMLQHRISGLPVVDGGGRVVGILTEGDLLRRSELGTDRHRARWVEFIIGPGRLALDYVDAHARTVGEVMTKNVASVTAGDGLPEVVQLMEKRHVKRVPVIDNGRLVGIVSRANLLQGLLAREPFPATCVSDDDQVRDKIYDELASHSWAADITNIVVDNGVVTLWGHVPSALVKEAVRIAVENVAGVRRVVNNVVIMPREV